MESDVRLVSLLLILLVIMKPASVRAEIDTEVGREILIEVDREFSFMSVERGAPEAFFQFMAEDGIQLAAGAEPIRGRTAMREALAGDYVLQWEPEDARVAISGDLGYTWGRYIITVQDSTGERRSSHGKYVTVWEKQSDGSWKFVLDCGNSNPDPSKEAEDSD